MVKNVIIDQSKRENNSLKRFDGNRDEINLTGRETLYNPAHIQEECLKLPRAAKFLENMPPKFYIN
jgi:hypothetical protein